MIIHFVTGNTHKLASLKQHIASFGHEVKQIDLGLIEPQADSVEEVALSKAQQAFQQLKIPVIVEDIGFYIKGLSGFPGPYTRYVLKTIGVEGLLRLAAPLQSRECGFLSVLAYMDERGVPRIFTDQGEGGVLAHEIDDTPCEGAWSDLWRIYIPHGASKPLSAFSVGERDALWDTWQSHSVYTQFVLWLQGQSDL